MFVGEAPGRLGADGSHLPFHGDKSGHNFERLIGQVGISRYQVFVTNAVLCNPKDESGNNSTPTQTEIANCSPFMRETIEILEPSVIVTLGAVALRSCSLIHSHSLTLRESVRTSNTWMSRILIPVYHPGQRAMLHRSFANQLSDYQFVAETLHRIKKPQKKRKHTLIKPESEKIGQIARLIMQEKGKELSYFALHKLCFLAEVAALDATARRLTKAYVVRQKDGPYFVDLHVRKLAQLIPGLVVRSFGGTLMLSLRKQIDFLAEYEQPDSLRVNEMNIVKSVIVKYGNMDDRNLKRVVYLNRYMRSLLRKEKFTGTNLYNIAVLPQTN
jgi:uracil-DNA glycosylase family 4